MKPPNAKLLMIWELNYLKVSGSQTFDLPSFQNHKIGYSSDRKVTDRLLNADFRKWVGLTDTEDLLSWPILYSIGGIPPEAASSFEYMYMSWFSYVRQQLFALWLLRDTAVDVKAVYVQVSNGSESRVLKTWGSMILSDSQGQKDVATFSSQELRDTFSFYVEKMEPLLQVTNDSLSDPSLVPVQGAESMDWSRVIAQKGVPRFVRYWHFLTAGRGTADLGVKIANYCTALESVFTLDQGEIVHKIAERVACFLGKDFDSKKQIFRDIKEAYSLRSKVVHGDVIGGTKLRGIKEVTKKLDNYLRAITNRWIEESSVQAAFALDSNALAEYLEELVLK